MAAESASFEESVEAVQADGPTRDGITLVLDHDHAMVGVARRLVGSWLEERGCRSGADAVLVLSELVTNAMVHAADGCMVEVRHRGDELRLEVRDRSRQAPVMKVVGPSDIGGRGLHVVDAVSASWGWEPTADGKSVWAIVDAVARDPHGDDRGESPSR